MIFDDPRRKKQKLFTWDIGLVICFLDGKELISFFFDISHDFLQFFDELVQSDVDLVIGLSPFSFDFLQSKIFRPSHEQSNLQKILFFGSNCGVGG